MHHFLPELDPALYSAYELAQGRCGGVGLAHLQGNSCDCCRTVFDQGRLSTLLAEAPLATCPSLSSSTRYC